MSQGFIPLHEGLVGFSIFCSGLANQRGPCYTLRIIMLESPEEYYW